jgi:hypothetical protein
VPRSNGGETVTGYQAIRSGKDAAGHSSALVNLSAGARSYTFKGLVSGTTYTLTVKARNPVGLSLGASAKATITAKPGRPVVSSVTAGSAHDRKTSIGVKWHKPSSGGAVKHYVITATRNGSHTVKSVTVSSRSRSASISGLQRNRAYVIRIRAVNASGSGPTARWARSVTAR